MLMQHMCYACGPAAAAGDASSWQLYGDSLVETVDALVVDLGAKCRGAVVGTSALQATVVCFNNASTPMANTRTSGNNPNMCPT
jgi:hypothetical protein